MEKNIKRGEVFFIGAGPGDPGLITVRGVECIRKADVIIYDYLASPFLLKHARYNSELIYVGKKGGNHTLSQDRINTLIVDKANRGKIVARLKGGDPFIFGRGGEEVEAVVLSGIPFEVIPGVTSAIAAAAYAGIPLTHRQYTADVSFVTGHEDPTKVSSNIDWSILGKGIGTLVFFMGVKNLANIVAKLKRNGRHSNTPVAVIRWGTTAKQVTVTGNLDTIVKKCEDTSMKPPAIIVIGEVVNLRKKMKWFENRPLINKSILVTRSRVQASNLVKQLQDLGAECIEYPTIEVIPPYNWTAVDNAIDNIRQYEWLIFTSVNGVDFFFERLFARGKDVRILGDIKTAVIGPATSKRLLKFGLKSDVFPKNYCAESVVSSFLEHNLIGRRICLPRAMEAREVLPFELSKLGAIVDDIPVYRTVKSDVDIDNLVDRLKIGAVDMITFTSSSTVSNFKNMLSSRQLKSVLTNVTIACIGPITAKTAHQLGFKVDVVAKNYTINGLCESILNYYA